ncbi:MAG: hypothetical protein PHD04_03435 [Candidatus Pacebacteria bacterium]|nr:hypothetical protein [Candidatus Paceibacterota bacterium]
MKTETEIKLEREIEARMRSYEDVEFLLIFALAISINLIWWLL